MAPQTSLLSLLFLLLLPRPSKLYSLHNCSLDEDLRSVDCDFRHLTTIPPDIPRSALLLSAMNNNLRRLGENELSGFDQLQTLNIGSNQISIIESGAFLLSPTLTELSLDQNKLTYLTRDMFKGLTNLTHLSLDYNQIKVIAKNTFDPLTNLQKLHLFSNNLHSVSDLVTSLYNCPHLQTLHLGLNQFTSFEFMDFPFPLIVTNLDLTSNPLEKFTLHENVLPHLTSLALYRIKSNLQWDVSNKSCLQNLRTLYLSGTEFTFETYKLIFQSVTLLDNLSLDLSKIELFLDRGLLDFVCAIPSLRKLDLSYNDLSVLHSSWLEPCSNIIDLDLSDNSISNLPSLHMLKHLSQLSIRANDLERVPETIRNTSSLTVLSLSANHISHLDCSDFSRLWRLTKLDLSYNRLTKLDSCVFHDLLSLQELNIKSNTLISLDNDFSVALQNLLVFRADDNIKILQDGVFKNMSHLREMTIGNGMIVSDGAFDGLMNLRYLSYKSFIFGTKDDLPVPPLFKDLHSLQTLILYSTPTWCYELPRDFLKGLDNLTTFSSSSFFCQPHPEMFTYTPRLMILNITHNDNWNLSENNLFKPLSELQHLDLSTNHLEVLDVLSEANLTKLERLNLAQNELRIIDKSIFKRLPSLKYLDLSDNPFVCNCSNADFISWVVNNKQVYVANAFQYRCSYPLSLKGNQLLSFNVQSCWESVSFNFFITSSSLVLVTLLSSFIYHFLRWQLIYSYYLFRAFLYDGRKRRQGCAAVYDAFVSYNVHDEEWVCYKLVPELEERQGWKLCLHHRDFEPGRAILENITDAIYTSRKTLCVISRRYLQSEWCSREIQMASFRLFDEQKDVLILLFLEEMSSAELSPFYRMRKLVKSRTYLSWTQTRSHRGLFWERVRQALESGDDPTETHDPLTADIELLTLNNLITANV